MRLASLRATVALLGTIALCACGQSTSAGSATQAAATPSVRAADAPPTAGVALRAGATDIDLYPELELTVARALEGVGEIPEDRRRELRKLALFLRSKRTSGEPAKLTFICTHNSRRSHMGRLWATTAAAYFGVDGVETFSGGTEATAFNPRAVAALERAGFRIERPADDAANPRYRVTFSPSAPALEAFSKRYDDAPNPSENFAAVMTCAEADRNCPTVAGAVLRVPIPYEDPKAADDTPEETARYDERSSQIATEMLYVFSLIAES